MIPRDEIAKRLIDGVKANPIAARNLATTVAHAYRYGTKTPTAPALPVRHEHADLANQIADILRGTDRRPDTTGRADRYAAHLILTATKKPTEAAL